MKWVIQLFPLDLFTLQKKYDGSMPTSYSTIERHFGTTEEFQSVVEAYKAKKHVYHGGFPTQ
ncbi:hypothetical protein OL548_10080 [Lysinibacillus sp. MHQ-1]|nr:hypothetical protein OL548_10080 [Lysinibacillus sp. MHQ-1]